MDIAYRDAPVAVHPSVTHDAFIIASVYGSRTVTDRAPGCFCMLNTYYSVTNISWELSLLGTSGVSLHA
ncbi:MAG TPA: hypothetical protein VIH76_07160 [Candidatus Acidoferrales bacterium]